MKRIAFVFGYISQLIVGRLGESACFCFTRTFRRLTESAYSELIFVALLLASASILHAEETTTNPPPTVATNALEAGTTVTPPLATAAPTNEPTIVTSERLQADYLHNVGTFEGNVLAVDPRMTVRADKMTVFFGATNAVTSAGTNATRAVQKIIAEGAVVINTPDNKTANSDYAEYTSADGKVVLTGKPRVETPDGVVTGQKITFWRGSQKMDVVATETNRTRLIIYPEEQRKKE